MLTRCIFPLLLLLLPCLVGHTQARDLAQGLSDGSASIAL